MRYLAPLLAVLALGCTSIHQGPSSSELTAGDEIHRQIISNYYLYTESDVNQYVSSIGHKIALASKRSRLSYDFVILYSDKIFATSIPGGRIYITTGFLAFLENEAELAGVLAHEIGELQYEDPDYFPTKKITNGAEKISAFALPFFGGIGALAFMGVTGVNAYASMEKTLPERVESADKIALNTMTKIGYDPQGFLDVIYRIVHLEDSKIDHLSDYYLHRPITVERVKKLKEAFKRLPLQNKSFNTNRDTYLERIYAVRNMYSNISNEPARTQN
jgi:predicted Zn-dependent protease